MTGFGAQSFQTSAVAPAARARAWSTAVTALHYRTSFETCVSTPYRGTFKTFAAEDFRVISFDEEQCSFRRDAEHIRADPATDIEILMPIAGGCTVEQFGVEALCKAGQFVLCDASAPFHLIQPRRMFALMLKVSRWEIERRVPDIESICARPVTCAVGVPRLALDLFHSIARESAALDAAAFRTSCHHLMDLFALAIDGCEFGGRSNSSVRAATLKRVKAAICERASNTGLSTRDIAASLGISERYVQSLFQDVGLTVRDYLRTVRLRRARALLSDPLHSRKSITEIAYESGFSSSAHFSSAFRDEYAQTPSDFKATIGRAGRS